ncbi:MAG: YARHG domain-containing protein [Mucilaginibacter sp.]|nr:YARHG domain-containing protein [Mucilaginibacter sp.]
MKTKPIILISLASIVLLAGIFFLVRAKSGYKSQSAQVKEFLTTFNGYVVKGEVDSIHACFDVGEKSQFLERFANIIALKAGVDGKSKPLAGINLDIDKAELNFINSEITEATIPVKFVNDSLPSRYSTLVFKIQKNKTLKLKITQVDAKSFFTDLVAYENYIRSKMFSESDIYNPITLKAFITANTLKSKYDSVIWFAHLKGQTYFYVVKGKWDFYKGPLLDSAKLYKMGLVGPDQKEIIPPEYDLIHNINGTFENLVEVEKDHKKGFYYLTGKIVVPVNYDQVFPVNDGSNIAALRNGQDFYWLKNDYSISEKVDLKIADILAKLKPSTSFTLKNDGTENVTEFNSHEEHGSIYIAPSYLAELNLIPVIQCFKNPLRNHVEYEGVSETYTVKANGAMEDTGNWFQTAFYNIREYFLGGRSGLYDKKNLIIIDNKHNRFFTTDIISERGEDTEGLLDDRCDVNYIKAINDSLFEVKAGTQLYTNLYDSTKMISGGLFYHYYIIKNNKLVELPNKRTFGFTKYVKMDDTYLDGCYNILIGKGDLEMRKKQTIDHLTPELLAYIKNEIYADYRYHFKDQRWKKIFTNLTDEWDAKNHPTNMNVDDSLTVIDKYNINFINEKLKSLKPATLAAK